MTIQLDTTGSVGEMPGWLKPVPSCNRFLRWGDLTPFTQGYVEAMFADADQTLGETATHDFGKGIAFSDLAPEALSQIVKDCVSFSQAGRAEYRTAEYGQGFWNERQDGQWSHFPPLTVTLGDDGKVRFA